MVEKVRRLTFFTFFVPAQVGLDVGDKFGEAGHGAKSGLCHPAIFRGISQEQPFLPACVGNLECEAGGQTAGRQPEERGFESNGGMECQAAAPQRIFGSGAGIPLLY
jgi:hypothetical protein